MKTEESPAPESATGELKQYLDLASSQIRHRLKNLEGHEPYSSRVATLRMLEELIKEQNLNENIGHSTRSSR